MNSGQGHRESAAREQTRRLRPGLGGRWERAPARYPRPCPAGSSRSSPRRRSRRCPRCGTRFQEWKSACSLRHSPARHPTGRPRRLCTLASAAQRVPAASLAILGAGIWDRMREGRWDVGSWARRAGMLGTVVHRTGRARRDRKARDERILIATRRPRRASACRGW